MTNRTVLCFASDIMAINEPPRDVVEFNSTPFPHIGSLGHPSTKTSEAFAFKNKSPFPAPMTWLFGLSLLLPVLLALGQVPAKVCPGGKQGFECSDHLDEEKSLLQHIRFRHSASTNPGQMQLLNDHNVHNGSSVINDISTTGKLARQMKRQLTLELNKRKGDSWELPRRQGNQSFIRTQGMMNVSEVVVREQTVFVKAAYEANSSQRGVAVEVNIELAGANEILWAFLLLWMPLLVAWLCWFRTSGWAQGHYEQSGVQYSQLLQFSVGALTISNVIGNQSLCILTRAPIAISVFQAAVSMIVGAILWTYQHCSTRFDNPSAKQICSGLWRWLPCAIWFACYQVADHFVSNTTSIAERVIFGNLVPVLSWVIETTYHDVFKASAQTSCSAKTALLTTVFGATSFVLGDPALAPAGLASCGLCGIILLIYRLVQRGTLVRLTDVPVNCLLTFDSLVMLAITSLLFGSADREVLREWNTWCGNPQVLMLLVLSGLGTGFGHLVVILCLKTSSATLTMVICNIASMICLVQGAVLFNEDESQHFLSFFGMAVNLIGGIWYAISQVEVPDEDVKEAH